MYIARTVDAFRAHRAAMAAPMGLVPTMGALHEGHRSLIRRAREECASVAVTIFVNPTQFGPDEDYTRYPRDEERDLEACRAEGADAVFMPDVAEMYPAGATTTVHPGPLAGILEGGSRPGHFEGVATVVTKLFQVTLPDRAYFGEKDGQQLLVIRRLVRDLLVPVEVVGCPTIREADGLALSSRNVYLSAEERQQAPAIARGLKRAKSAWLDGLRDADALRRIVRDEIAAQPLADIDYVSLADIEMLQECSGRIEGEAMLSVAVRFGSARLIDNAVLRA
jgi:pantoate--beta-alanine ligase